MIYKTSGESKVSGGHSRPPKQSNKSYQFNDRMIYKTVYIFNLAKQQVQLIFIVC